MCIWCLNTGSCENSLWTITSLWTPCQGNINAPNRNRVLHVSRCFLWGRIYNYFQKKNCCLEITHFTACDYTVTSSFLHASLLFPRTLPCLTTRRVRTLLLMIITLSTPVIAKRSAKDVENPVSYQRCSTSDLFIHPTQNHSKHNLHIIILYFTMQHCGKHQAFLLHKVIKRDNHLDYQDPFSFSHINLKKAMALFKLVLSLPPHSMLRTKGVYCHNHIIHMHADIF